ATHESRREALAATFSLRNTAIEGISGLVPLLPFYQRREEQEISRDVREWLDLLVTEVDRSRRNASEQLAQLDELIGQSQQLEGGMGLRFLYDEERRIFAIGYQVAERRPDTSFYDLLASEARLTSFLAIARGEVPVEHWWALSRPFGSAYGRLPLLSWSGTMFEYLMPLLFTQTHENSLLDRACYDAVRCQIGYARQNRVPWGISESAFSALDRHNVYQYRAFGVPALALKRGQDEDLVVAPYAAALALGVEPAAAIKNLRRLANLGDSALLADYGYYEAIDYSPRTHLLSNGTCSVTVTNSGGGYLRWLDLDVTRWRADATCDVSGSFCYIRDLESGTTWSNTHQPVRSPERRYTWNFTPDKAEFRRRSGPCETITEIVVSAEDDAEVRRVTLVNTSRKTCELEL